MTAVEVVNPYSATAGSCLSSEDCRPPCPREDCRHHLASGARWRARARAVVPGDTCVLRLSTYRRTLEEVAVLLGCTRERVRQVEVAATRKVADMVRKKGWFQ